MTHTDIHRLWKIHNKYYDLEPFLQKHPGGARMLRLGQGRDCTELFESMHGLSPQSPEKSLHKYHVASAITQDSVFDWSDDGLYSEICRRVRNHFRDTNRSPKASPALWLLITLTLLSWIAAFASWVASANPWVGALTGFLGLSLCMSVFHTASHGALSKKSWVNYFWSVVVGDFHGFFNPIWMQHHVYGHHSFTGLYRKDPDIGNAIAIVRKSPKSRWRPIHAHQHYLSPVLLIVVPGQWVGQCIQYAIAAIKGKLFGMPLARYRKQEALLSAAVVSFSLLLHLVIPFWLHGFEFVPALIAYAIAMNATYWAVVFPNHDTDKTHHKEKAARDFAEQQIRASLTVKMPALLAQFFGGMNFQIEHHLFPGVAPCHYPRISQLVRECCAERGIPYPTYSSWTAALRGHLRHLQSLSASSRQRISESYESWQS